MNCIKFQRQGNAPSIPSSGFNNGYEEDSHGILKPQDVPAPDSTLGPAYYNVPSSNVCCCCMCGALFAVPFIFPRHYNGSQVTLTN